MRAANGLTLYYIYAHTRIQHFADAPRLPGAWLHGVHLCHVALYIIHHAYTCDNITAEP